MKEACLEKETWYKVPDYKVMLVKEGVISTKKKKIGNPEDLAEILKKYLEGVDREVFCSILLDRKNNILGVNTISVGGLFTSLAHPREVFKPALILGAAAIVLGHNHPSGDPSPSEQDCTLTEDMVEAGKILGIEILDHVIIGDDEYYSFKMEGLL